MSNVQNVSRSLDAFELQPLTFEPTKSARGSGSLFVERPTASGTLTTDRIVYKPSALEVKYLPGARWTEEAPAHFQWLLLRSLTNTGHFSHVTVGNAGPTPDFILLSDLHAFHASVSQYDDLLPDKDGTVSVTIEATFTIVRDRDQSVLGARIFESQANAASDFPSVLIPAFDRAMQTLLRDVIEWVIADT